ncbi:MAG: FAD-dependent thymidylate synthase [Candidatus Marsarchaeota archaeon]|jgi:thymidylate synthase ThyX|nr:FAD-dependent thymidylate synthase [Candidatus Marsarchaeota archaeon]
MPGSYTFPIGLDEREKELVRPFFTNVDRHVFALINMPEVVKGTLFSRYSRSEKSARRLLLDEFIPNKEVMEAIEGNMPSKGIEANLAIGRAEDFYQRVLVGYGDDSVAELAGSHAACENISSLAADLITDSRIGFSYLEKSARYIPFDKKVDGKYLWFRSPKLMESRFGDAYERTMDLLFDEYSRWLPVVISYAKENNPRSGDTTERAYENAMRAKACDVLKNLLTAGRLTNIGLFGNGRAYEYLLTRLYSSNLAEGVDLAGRLHAELSLVIPSFVKRSQLSEYITKTRETMGGFYSRNMKQGGAGGRAGPYLELVDYDRDAEAKVLASMLYPYSNLDLNSLRGAVVAMAPEQRKELVKAYLSNRRNRRDKPGRALESAYYTFELCANYGIFRDLHRHRMLTLERQVLGTSLGYDVPEELVALGLDREYARLMEEVAEVHREIAVEMPIEAQYVVPRSYHMRWYMKMNLREVYHLAELRSTKQGHPDYRKIAQNMKRMIEKVHPVLAEFMQVDMNDYALARLDSERRIDRKLAELDGKTGVHG